MTHVVLGGGIAGLTAAYELVKAGKTVLVLERSSKIGGAISTYEIYNGSQHYFIEAFYHHIFPFDTNTLEMFKELGIDNNVEWLPATTAFYQDSKLYKLTTPIDLLFYKPLSLKNRIIMIKLLWKIIHEKSPLQYDSIPTKEWIIKNGNKEIFDKFFAGLLRGKFSSASDETSAGWFIGRIQLRGKRSLGGETLGYLWGGYQQLTEALLKRIEENGGKIITDVNIKTAKLKDGKVESINFVKDKKEYTVPVESVTSTIPPSALTSIFDLPQSYTKMIELPYQGAVCILVALKKKLHPYYWTNVLADTAFAAIIEHTNFTKEEQYGEHLVYLASYPDYSSPFWKMGDNEVFNIYFKDLQKIFPHITFEDVNWWKVSKYPKAGLIYSTGIMSRVRGIGVKTPIKNLFVCGMFNSLRERSVDESIKIAKLAANEAMKV